MEPPSSPPRASNRPGCIVERNPTVTPSAHKTLGRLSDLRRLRERTAHDMLVLPGSRWTRALNRSWIEEGLRRYEPFLLISDGDFRGTILEWELRLVRAAGYRRQGRWWRPL